MTTPDIIPTEKPVLALKKHERHALGQFIKVHWRYVEKEFTELQKQNEVARLQLDAIREREVMKFR